MSADSNTAVYNNGTAGRFNDGPHLIIQAVTMKDLGDFTCLARNGGTSTLEKVFTLELAGPEKLENVTVKRIHINFGGRVIMKCPLSPGPGRTVHSSSQIELLLMPYIHRESKKCLWMA